MLKDYSSEITNEQFHQFKDSLKVVSNIKFKKVIDKQRGVTADDFIQMLEGSTYFKDFFFEAFIEGIDYAKKVRQEKG